MIRRKKIEASVLKKIPANHAESVLELYIKPVLGGTANIEPGLGIALYKYIVTVLINTAEKEAFEKLFDCSTDT